jgi:hypothetical protein
MLQDDFDDPEAIDDLDDEEAESLLGRDPVLGRGGDPEADLHGDRLAEIPDDDADAA